MDEESGFRKVIFRVTYDPRAHSSRIYKFLKHHHLNYTVAILGDVPSMGAWKIENALKLNKVGDVWEGTAEVLPEMEYKYIILSKFNHILQWETLNRKIHEDVNLIVEEFGKFPPEILEQTSSKVLVDTGWVYNNVQIELHQFNFKMHEGYTDIRFKIISGNNLCSIVQEEGVYCITAPQFQDIVVYVDVCNAGERIGRGVLVAQEFRKGRGTIIASILHIQSFTLIGEIHARFIVIHPFVHPENTLQNVWRTYWKSRGHPLYIGHRGMGVTLTPQPSMKRRPSLSENTVLSMVASAKAGADFVEFDVQLTKDEKVIIFHDMQVKIHVGETTLPVFVKDLTLEQLKKLQLHLRPAFDSDTVELLQSLMKRRKKFSRVQSLENLRNSKTSPSWAVQDELASLEDLFYRIPESVGFNIEIKYPMDDEMVQVGMESYFERNRVVDAILKIIFDNAGNRRIIISSFDPDICLIVAMKQPRYPVFFLTEGGTFTFKDPRCNSVLAAAQFAKVNHIVGIVSNAQPILENTDLVKQVKDAGILLMTFGEANSNPISVAIQQQLGVDAIICDNVGVMVKSDPLRKEKLSRTNVFVFESLKPPSENWKT